MARIARVIAAGIPHHITQRGNRRMQTFFCDDDYREYIGLMAEWCRNTGVAVWAYCLMPNHVHLIAVPEREESLRLGIGEAHRRYSRRINFRENWRGHLWAGRFSSFPMAETHLLAAARYVELNPVRANLCTDPEAWPWSSAAAHIAAENDSLVTVAPLLEIVPLWKKFLMGESSGEQDDIFRRHERTGRPLGQDDFIQKLELDLGRELRPAKPGRKAKQK